MSRPRILLADDHSLVLEAFTKLLETECDIAGTVTDGLTLLKSRSTIEARHYYSGSQHAAIERHGCR